MVRMASACLSLQGSLSQLNPVYLRFWLTMPALEAMSTGLKPAKETEKYLKGGALRSVDRFYSWGRGVVEEGDGSLGLVYCLYVVTCSGMLWCVHVHFYYRPLRS